jgi:high-affinity nickel permease
MTNGDDKSGGMLKPVTQVVTALQGSPMLLVLAVLNVLILGMVVYLAKARSETVAAERTEILKLLDDCLSRQKSSIIDPSRTTTREKDDAVHGLR